MTADTMIVTTPVRLELARKPFSMVISAATPDSAAIMLVRPTITPQPGGPVVNYKFSLPVYLSRVGTDSTLTVSSDGMVMERAP